MTTVLLRASSYDSDYYAIKKPSFILTFFALSLKDSSEYSSEKSYEKSYEKTYSIEL